MIVVLRYERPLRSWHRRLLEQLGAAGHTVRLEPVGRLRSTAVDLVVAVERRLYRSLSSPGDAEVTSASSALAADVTIALVGGGPTTGRVLEPLFDGRAGIDALVGSLLRGQAPVVTIRDRSSGDELATGRPAIEDPGNFTHAMRQVFVRLGALLVQALRGLATVPQQDRCGAGDGVSSPANREAAACSQPLAHLVEGEETFSTPPEPTAAITGDTSPDDGDGWHSGASFLLRGVTSKLAHKFGPARGRPEHWRIGYRLTRDAGVARTRAWPGESFAVLPDDGERFYADPFPFEHDGRHYLFFENFPYATGKGVIGVVEIGADGTASTPRIVLEQPVHLSYPLITRHEGDIFMLPEMSGARRIQLFRADPFPGRWVPADILLDDVVAADGTPIRHGDRFWLFATLAGDGGSSWDQLGLFHAPALGGPWTPHAANPVLIDAGAARPAGAMWHEDGVLMRVAQDCRSGYGVGLAICRVDRLDEHGYAQTVVSRLAPPAGSGARGVHTLNRAGSLEVVDLKVAHPKPRRG